MPCSSPPGIFDLLTPHTLYISLLGGLLFPGFFLGLVGVWVVSFARLLRRNAPIWQAHWGLRWQARLSIGGLGLCILLMSVGGLWSAALDAWVHQVYYLRCSPGGRHFPGLLCALGCLHPLLWASRSGHRSGFLTLCNWWGFTDYLRRLGASAG